MDGVTEREVLQQIADQCSHVLDQRIAKRFSTRDQLKALKVRATALLKREDGRDWSDEFGRIFTVAESVFDAVIAETGETFTQDQAAAVH
jgi:hypothetical protein